MSDGESAQSPLFGEQVLTETETAPATVWVVVSRKMDSPHPYVEAVYDDEDAAKAHKREIANDSFGHGVVAWDVFERPVQSEYGEQEADQ